MYVYRTDLFVRLSCLALTVAFSTLHAATASAADEEAAIRAAALAGTKAMYGEDLDAVKKIVVAETPDQAWRIIEIELKTRKTRHALAAEIVKRFGQPGKTYAASLDSVDNQRLKDEVAQIERGKVVVKGTSAKIDDPIATGPYARTYFLLRKVNGDWKTLNTYGFSADRDVAQEFKSRDAKLAKLQAFVVKVRDGVYKSLDDIDRELYDWEFGDEKAKGYRVMPRMPIDPKTGKQIWPEDIVAPPGAGDGIVVPLPDPARAAANSAKRIVFILDGSQAAKPSFDSLILHIRNAVDDLKSSQSFGVLISGNGKLLKLDEKDLLPATAQNKQKVGALTKGVEAGGKSDFAAALTAAVALKPELIYLTACDLPADAKLVDTARVLTKNQNVKINVIAIEIKGSAEKELKTIATESGGAFRWISIKDLEQQ